MLCTAGNPSFLDQVVRLLAAERRCSKPCVLPGVSLPVRVRGSLRTQDIDPELRNSAALQGEYWTFQYGGWLSRLRDRAGFRHLAILLERPHDAVPALTLMAGPVETQGLAARSRTGELREGWPADLGDMLDCRARAEYRERLEDLETLLEEAERAGDTGRAGLFRAETRALREALGAALGLGRRARRAGSPVERARINVTRTLRVAIRRLRMVDPALGAHLARSVRTGTFCCYAPPEPTHWTVMRLVPQRVHASGRPGHSADAVVMSRA